MLGIILALGHFVKIGYRDLTAIAFIHTTMANYQLTQNSKLPPVSKEIDVGDWSLLLIPVYWQMLVFILSLLSNKAPVVNANTNHQLNPPSVASYIARQNVLLRETLQSKTSDNSHADPPSLPDSGIENSISSYSDDERPAVSDRHIWFSDKCWSDIARFLIDQAAATHEHAKKSPSNILMCASRISDDFFY